MISPQLQQLIRPLVLIQRVIWVVITGSILFYFGIIYVLVGNSGTGTPPRVDGLETVMYIVAAAVSVC